MIRLCVFWLEEGEKFLKYFCNLEFCNFLNKIIKKIEVDGIGMVYD